MTSAREEAWREYALCGQVVNAEIFHPTKGGSTADGKRICAACDVRAICLEYSLSHGENEGIWGGMGEQERKKLRKERARESEMRNV